MLDRHKKVWLHYRNNIMAEDVPSGAFLHSYIRYSEMNRKYLPSLEVIDLQKNKIVRERSKVHKVIRGAEHPFVFVVGKN